MAMTYNEDQSMLRDSARDFMKTEAPVAHLRKYRDMDCKDGFSHDLWKQFSEMGFTGILIPEADGGLGMGHVEAGIVLEEMGATYPPRPSCRPRWLLSRRLKPPTRLCAIAGSPASLPARP